MFKHVLIGVDGRSGGRTALALAQTLLPLFPEADVTLAHVCVEAERSRGQVLTGFAARSASVRMLIAERAHAGIEAGLAWIAAPTAAVGLTALLLSGDADLLILGSDRQRPVSRVQEGEICRGALRRAHVAVAVAPPGCEAGVVPAVLGVPCDGSVEAAAAFDLAWQLHLRSGAKIISAAVIPSQTGFYRDRIRSGPTRALEMVFSEDQLRAHREGEVEMYLGRGGSEGGAQTFSRRVDLLILGASVSADGSASTTGGSGAFLAAHAHCPSLLAPCGHGPRERELDAEARRRRTVRRGEKRTLPAGDLL